MLIQDDNLGLESRDIFKVKSMKTVAFTLKLNILAMQECTSTEPITLMFLY